MKRCSALAIREMQIRATVRYHFTHSGGSVKQTVSSAGKDVEKWELSCTAVKDVKVQRRGKQFGSSSNH